jgi:proteic killer suppression protein
VRRLFEENDHSGIRPVLVAKVQKILSALDTANGPEDMAPPTFRLHQSTGDRRGTYSATVNANWRVTFRFHDVAVYDANLQDYH